jgi:hypothetical protein
MIELTKRLEAKYETYSKLKVLLNERQQQIVALIKMKETIQISEIEHVLEHYSRNTIKKDLLVNGLKVNNNSIQFTFIFFLISSNPSKGCFGRSNEFKTPNFQYAILIPFCNFSFKSESKKIF